MNARQLAEKWIGQNPIADQDTDPLAELVCRLRVRTKQDRAARERKRKIEVGRLAKRGVSAEERNRMLKMTEYASIDDMMEQELVRINCMSATQRSERIAAIEAASEARKTAHRLLLRYLFINGVQLDEAQELAKELVPPPCGRGYAPDAEAKQVLHYEQTHRSSYKSEMNTKSDGTARRFDISDVIVLYNNEMSQISRARDVRHNEQKLQLAITAVSQAVGMPVLLTNDTQAVTRRRDQYKHCYLALMESIEVSEYDTLRKAMKKYYAAVDHGADPDFIAQWKQQLVSLRSWRFLQCTENAVRHRWLCIRADAAKLKREFALSREFFAKLATEHPECHYCLSQPPKKYYCWGLDRVDNDKGYIEANVVPCCFLCNRMKSTRLVGEFTQIARAVSAHQHGAACELVPLRFAGSESSSTYESYRAGAVHRSLPFSLTPGDFAQLVALPCFYCGRPQPSGIDRKNKGDGYSVQTCVASCWPCNKTKSDIDFDTFLYQCTLIASNERLTG